MIDNLKDAIAHAKEEREKVDKTLKYWESINAPLSEQVKYEIGLCKDKLTQCEQTIAWLTELQERRKADRWIPVSERTPDEDVDVIVSDMETYETYSAYYVGDGYWACDNGTYKHRITHWKPFPKKCDESGETIGEKFLSGWRNKSEATND